MNPNRLLSSSLLYSINAENTPNHTTVLRGLSSFLSKDRPEDHSLQTRESQLLSIADQRSQPLLTEGKRMEKGRGRSSTLWGREWSAFNQTYIGTDLRCHVDLRLNGNFSSIWLFVLFVGYLTSQQHASVHQERICSDNLMSCHTEIEVVDQTFHLTQSPALTL